MQIESFRVFRDLVETQNFSKAAQLNGITQSAVSQQIRAIEERFRVPLIERSSKRFALSREGGIMYQASKEIITQFDSLQHQFNEMRDIVSGNIRLATVYSIGLHELPPYLKKFLREFPNVNVHVEYRRSNQVYEDVQTGTSDLGLVAFPAQKKHLKTEVFKQDRLVVIAAPTHPLAGQAEIDLAELTAHKLIGFEPDIPTRRAVDKMFREAGYEPKPVMEFDNIETVKRAVEIDAGISIVPRATIEQEVKAKSLAAIEFKHQPYFRPLGIIYKQGRVLSPAMKRFLKTLRDPLA
ncbi:MAG: LysR family transcriptional regulator [Verrucomicrobiales bacterium]|nr:LysR family transcriptional regulator [Verrucomicrobiales bacterium]